MKPLIVAAALASAVWGATCVSFGPLPPNSRCVAASPELRWANAPPRAEPLTALGAPYETALSDPAITSGAVAAGDVRLRLEVRGRHLVEAFLIVPDGRRASFALAVNGKLADTRSQRPAGVGLRFYPGSRLRRPSLIAWVDGPSDLEVRAESERYALAMVRWTPEKEFEERLVPEMLARARRYLSTLMLEGDPGGPLARRAFAEQLCDRLIFSRRPEVRREALTGRARAIYWLAAENHEPFDIVRLGWAFEEALREAPEDLILRQTVSASCRAQNVGGGRPMSQGTFCEAVKPLRWDVAVPPAPPGAPAWAVEQRKLARRMERITAWWVEKRQRANGELGGGWGDDVEILRQWGPQALGLGSAAATRGIRRLADGLWESGQLVNGYDKRVSDVEHSSEPSTDTLPLLAAVAPEESVALGRLRLTASCAENWIKLQPDGHWRFRSSWFNCREADATAGRDVDVHLNTRAMGPALWYAYLSRDPALIGLIAKWVDSWAAAMRATAHGKPKGAIPSVLRSADGTYLIGSDRWDKPSSEWDYFQWSGGSQEALASLLLAVHDMTGDQRWLEAARESFALLDNCREHAELCQAIRAQPQAFYEWRRRSGDARHDRFLGYLAGGGDGEILAKMARQARETEESFAYDFDMYTSEVMYTDRVYYALPAEYKQALFGGEAPRGDRYPTFHVTWPAVEGEFARAVMDAMPRRLRLRAYNFESREVNADVRVWRLEQGEYRWRLLDSGGAGAGEGRVTISKLPQVVRLPLPPRKEVVIILEKS